MNPFITKLACSLSFIVLVSPAIAKPLANEFSYETGPIEFYVGNVSYNTETLTFKDKDFGQVFRSREPGSRTEWNSDAKHINKKDYVLLRSASAMDQKNQITILPLSTPAAYQANKLNTNFTGVPEDNDKNFNDKFLGDIVYAYYNYLYKGPRGSVPTDYHYHYATRIYFELGPKRTCEVDIYFKPHNWTGGSGARNISNELDDIKIVYGENSDKVCKVEHVADRAETKRAYTVTTPGPYGRPHNERYVPAEGNPRNAFKITVLPPPKLQFPENGLYEDDTCPGNGEENKVINYEKTFITDRVVVTKYKKAVCGEGSLTIKLPARHTYDSMNLTLIRPINRDYKDIEHSISLGNEVASKFRLGEKNDLRDICELKRASYVISKNPYRTQKDDKDEDKENPGHADYKNWTCPPVDLGQVNTGVTDTAIAIHNLSKKNERPFFVLFETYSPLVKEVK